MMNDDTGSILFSMPSTDPFRYVICAHCEPAVILDKPRVPAVNLPILVFYGKCQLDSTVLAESKGPTGGCQTTQMKSDYFVRDIHTSGLKDAVGFCRGLTL